MFEPRLMTMKNAQLALLLVICSILLSSCGARTEDASDTAQPTYNANGDLVSGGDNSGFALGQTNPDDELRLRVVSDEPSLPTGGDDVATITVLATDVNNNAVADAEILFSSSSGVLQNISPQTDANGEASATLKLPQDFQNQEIIVTASASDGEYVSAVKIITTGSVLDVTGPDNLVSGDNAELVVRLTAGNGQPIPNQIVSVTSAAGNSITPAELLATDADGRVSFVVGSENSSDTLRISALNSTVSATHSFDVVEDLLSFTNITDETELVVGSQNMVQVNWISQSEPVQGQALSFSITSGSIESPTTVVTDASGNASVLVSSSSAGPAKITVEATQGGSPVTDIDVEFIATVPHSITMDASTSLVNINETSTISALVKDLLGNPVKNSEVNFASVDLKGGQLNPASATTNSAGIASVTFTAGENATEVNEIAVQATVKGTAISDSIAMTVFKRALNVTLGSANLITIKPLGTQYAMPLVVQVADGSGTPLENATVKVSVRPLWYGKGEMELVDRNGRNITQALNDGDDFNASYWALADDSIVCPTEDLDGDRYLDTLDALSEDTNNNGALDPQDPASLAAIDGGYATLAGGSLQTDKNGSGYFELLYPASNAAWSGVEITARAEALGAEASDTYTATLASSAEAMNNTQLSPANHYSPYGSFDVRNDEVRVVTINGESWPVLGGCMTTR